MLLLASSQVGSIGRPRRLVGDNWPGEESPYPDPEICVSQAIGQVVYGSLLALKPSSLSPDPVSLCLLAHGSFPPAPLEGEGGLVSDLEAALPAATKKIGVFSYGWYFTPNLHRPLC